MTGHEYLNGHSLYDILLRRFWFVLRIPGRIYPSPDHRKFAGAAETTCAACHARECKNAPMTSSRRPIV